MKVIFLNSSMGKGVTTRLLIELSQDFRSRGVDASVWGLYKENEMYTSESGSLCILDHPPSMMEYPKVLFRLTYYLRKYQPDVLFCSLPFANILGGFSGRLSGVKKIIPIHHDTFPDNKNLFFRVRIEMLLGLMGAFHKRVGVSNAVKESYYNKFDTYFNRFEVIYNAANLNESLMSKTKARDKFALPHQTFLISTVGRIAPQKNHKFLLNILKEIPEISLAICGDGELKEELLARAKELQIEDRIHLTGHISSKEVADFLRAGDLFVFPSLHEGFGLAVVEAMQSGLPVIASDISTLQEVVGEAGVLLPLNSELWINQIEKFMNNEKLLSKYSNKSTERAKEFTFKNMSDQYYNIAIEN